MTASLKTQDRGRTGTDTNIATAPEGTPASESTRADIRPTRTSFGPGRKLRFGPLIGIGLLLAGWIIGSAAGLIDPRILATPWQVAGSAAELTGNGRLPDAVIASLTRAGLGVLLGVITGVLLAVIAGLSRIGEYLVDGPVQVKRSIPTLALIPLLILWFGIGEDMKILTIGLATMVPVYMNSYDGLRSIDSRYAELAATLQVTRVEFIRRVILPGSLPGFVLGLRYGVTAGLLALVVVEQVNTTSGIGYLITLASNYGQTEIIIVGLVVYAILGVTADAVIRFTGGKALSWRRTMND